MDDALAAWFRYAAAVIAPLFVAFLVFGLLATWTSGTLHIVLIIAAAAAWVGFVIAGVIAHKRHVGPLLRRFRRG